MGFATDAIHVGQEPDPATGAIVAPIYQTSTYVQDAVGEHKGYDYSRVANPTRHALETALASLESAEHGVAYSSGLGATTAGARNIPTQRSISKKVFISLCPPWRCKPRVIPIRTSRALFFPVSRVRARSAKRNPAAKIQKLGHATPHKRIG